MAADNPRIDELRRRIQQDPASIAFAQLAEEYRRSGDHEEAVRVCRAGLAHHPSYLSARVTLGRALMALGQYGDAEAEFEHVLQAAPDNLLARKSLDELQSSGYAPAAPDAADVPAPDVADVPAPEVADVPAPAPEAVEASAPDAVDPPAPDAARTALPEDASADAQTPADPALPELEGWLSAIRADRTERASGST